MRDPLKPLYGPRNTYVLITLILLLLSLLVYTANTLEYVMNDNDISRTNRKLSFSRDTAQFVFIDGGMVCSER